MLRLTRRHFLTLLAATGLRPGQARATPLTGFRFFDTGEARFVMCACERLIPPAGERPGANGAAVPAYIDAQLAGPWGAGLSGYRAGAWQAGAAPTVHEAPTPAAFFRAALRGIDDVLSRHRIRFDDMSEPAQTAFLVSLAEGHVSLPGMPAPGGLGAGTPAAAFFALLLQMTVEGFLLHPVHGASLERLAWRLHDFPGAHAFAHATAA